MPTRPHFPQNDCPHGQDRVPPKAPKATKLGALPEWNLNDLYPGLDEPGAQARSRAGRHRLRIASRRTYKGAAGRDGGRRGRGPHARRGGPALRSDRRSARPADLLCLAGLCRQHHRSGRAPNSMATCRSASPRPRCICCSSRSSSTASTTRTLDAAMARSRARPLPAVDRGRAQGKAVPARRPRRATVPREIGDRLFGLEPVCSTRPLQACASRSPASRWRSSRRSI